MRLVLEIEVCDSPYMYTFLTFENYLYLDVAKQHMK